MVYSCCEVRFVTLYSIRMGRGGVDEVGGVDCVCESWKTWGEEEECDE